MEEGMFAILWLIVVSIGIIVTIIYLRKYSNLEKMSMIEKGMNPSDIVIKKQLQPIWPLRFALLFIGAGVGLLAGNFLDVTFHMDEVAYFSMLFICGGAGLGISYMIEEKKEKERERESA